MKFRFSISLLLILFYQNVNAQLDISPLDTLFEGGKEAYDQLANDKLHFPFHLAEDGIYGTLVFEISVEPAGFAITNILTRLDGSFETQATLFIQEMESRWLPKSKSYTVYQPVFFGYSYDESASVSEEINSFPSSYEFPVLEPIVRALVVTRVTGSSPRAPSSDRGLTLGDIGLDKINETTKKPTEKERSAVLKQEVKKYLKNESKYLKQLDKGNLDKAFEYLCDMIRFNPFDPELIQKRMELAQELKVNDYVNYDTPWLEALRRMGR